MSIRILMVADYDDGSFSYVSFGPTARPTPAHPTVGFNDWFGLSEVVSALQSSPAPVTFTVTKAHRRDDPQYPSGTPVPPGEEQFAPDLRHFRFDDPAVDLNAYDQIWLFGVATEGAPAKLDPTEVTAIFTFMQNGGGVFATGDHWDMGAALCGAIPRVRSMRRWYFGDQSQKVEGHDYDNDLVFIDADRGFSAPSAFGKFRHDTTRPDPPTPVPPVIPFDMQSDRVPQALRLEYVYSGNSFIEWKQPHPLMCSAEGDINVFPDHMHEGEAVVPWEWTRSYPVNGAADAPEYPMAYFGTRGDGSPTVQPQVVAWAKTIGGHTTSSAAGHTGENLSPVVDEEFGAVGAYDGAAEHVGRVVVDSTWHHFFDINLIGDPASPVAARKRGFQTVTFGGLVPDATLRKMHAYYRNIGLWLARPESQLAVLADALALVVGGQPFNEIASAQAAYSDLLVAELGAQAADKLRGLVTMCSTISAIHLILYYLYPIEKFPPDPPGDPWWWQYLELGDPAVGVIQPRGMAETMLGGAVVELLALRRAPEFRKEGRHDAKLLRDAVGRGLLRGREVYGRGLERTAKRYEEAAARMQASQGRTERR